MGAVGKCAPTPAGLEKKGMDMEVKCTGTPTIARMIERFKDTFIPGQAGLSVTL